MSASISTPPINETVGALARVKPSWVGKPALVDLLVRSGVRPRTAEKTAYALWERYCRPEPREYTEIARDLGTRAPYPRKLAVVGLDTLRGDARARGWVGSNLEPGTRLYELVVNGKLPW